MPQDAPLLPVAEAFARVAERVPRWPTEQVRIERAVGRILAETVRADRDQPPFDRVTMDGIAVASAALAAGTERFRIAGVQAAGRPAPEPAAPEACWEVTTGAVLPPGTDTVIPVEQLDLGAGFATLANGTAPGAVAPGQHVHRRGTDYPAGAALLEPGLRLGPPEIAVLASVGLGRVTVGGVPRVTVVSTGDELVAADERVAPHQIRRANDYAIAAALHRRGVGTSAALHLRDDRASLRAAIAGALEVSDVLVLSGGVSKGRFDHLPGVFEALGVERVFHRVRQRPGKPLWFGTSAGKCVFGLPGNPVSALVCLYRYVLPALVLGAGGTPEAHRVTLGADLAFGNDLTRFVPVTVTPDAAGRPVAVPHELNTSGDFFGLAGSSGLVELDGDQRHWRAGTVVPLLPW